MPLVLDGTNGVGGVNGSASSPAFEGTDADSGIFINSANEVNASLNSTPVWSAVSTFGFKNRIINGAMVIDQRNAGASVTGIVGSIFAVDRFYFYNSQASKFTAQQNAGSVTPPAGFVNYLGVTSSSSYTSLSTDVFSLGQVIEGRNIADLGWGTASASAVTLSFWARSSLTGTFSGALANSGFSRSYPFTYTISAANTWEYKTVTIPGDTSGTWLTNNNAGIYVAFDMGTGSNRRGTAGSWASAAYEGATGSVSVVGTNGATFYITGVQLEKGSTATSFDYRPYTTELQLCQRYYTRLTSGGTGPFAAFGNGIVVSSTAGNGFIVRLPTTMRAPPTPTVSNCRVYDGSAAAAVTAIINATDACNPNALGFDLTVSGAALTAFRPSILQGNNNTAAFIEANAEL